MTARSTAALEEALTRLLELLFYYASSEVAWETDRLVQEIREALRQGEEARRALEAAFAREAALRETLRQARDALGGGAGGRPLGVARGEADVPTRGRGGAPPLCGKGAGAGAGIGAGHVAGL